MALYQARRRGVRNFSMLASHVLVPPAIAAILHGAGNRVQAFLGPGHVCAVVGYHEYEPLVARERVPIVITGFEPIDLLEGILMAVRQLEAGRAEVENQYARTVTRDGNRLALQLLAEVFEVTDRQWRGVGMIPASGYRIRYQYRDHDAERIFDLDDVRAVEPAVCISGQVLRGLKRPSDCPAFGGACTPRTPLGATMVSSEGACAAYFQYRRRGIDGMATREVRVAP
jgi:hydrogenase expression/formation protein HypD